MLPQRGGRRPWRQLPKEFFRFTTTESADLHVAVAFVLAEAAVTHPALSFDQVRAGLIEAGWDAPLADDDLHQTLTALVRWDHVEATQSHSAVYATPQEFERRNLQYSITLAGQAAVAGIGEALAVLSRTVSLQPAVLDAIAEGLADLVRLLTSSPVDTSRVYTGLMEVENHHRLLVDNIRQFNTELQRLVGDRATDDDVFFEVKQQTVGYLQEYVRGIEAPLARLAHAIDGLNDLGPSRLFDAALVGANLATFGDEDPGPMWLAERAARWSAIRAWFNPDDPTQGEPRINASTSLANQGIIALLRVMERRWDSRRRRAAVDDDYRQLADLFVHCPDERTAHGLFQAAFGIWPSRHPHLLPTDHEAIARRTSWLDAPAVEVSPTLRTSGTESTGRGRMRPVRDPSADRARRRQEQQALLAQVAAVRQALVTDGPVPLSSFGYLDPDQFAEFLRLLGLALNASVGTDGTQRATSTDGQVDIVLAHRPTGGDGVVKTDAGTLRGPDLLVAIVVADNVRSTGPPPVGIEHRNLGPSNTGPSNTEHINIEHRNLGHIEAGHG